MRNPKSQLSLVSTALAVALSLALTAAPAFGRTTAELLSDRPLPPTDPGVFDDRMYPQTGPMAPAQGAPPSEAQASTLLDQYLAAEFPDDSVRQRSAKAVFDSPTAKQKLPSPSLRAALAALAGTLGEPAIAFVLDAKTPGGEEAVRAVRFVDASQLGSDDNIAETFINPANGQIEIRVNDRYAAENPFLLTSTMGHEPLHQDPSVDNYEEAVAHSLDELIYIHQLVRHPELASTGTGLARTHNSTALMRFNSGTGSQLGLYATNDGASIAPGSTTLWAASWWEVFGDGSTTETPGSPLLDRYLFNIQPAGTAACSGVRFSKAALDCIDRSGNARLTHDELLGVARTLKLDVDSDGDGWFDRDDGCPQEPAATTDGCPGSPAAEPEPPRPAQIAAALMRSLKPLRRLSTKRVLRRRGFAIRNVETIWPGRLRLQLVVRAGRVTLARGSRSFGEPGARKIKLRLTRAGGRLLRRKGRAKARLWVSFAPRGAPPLERARTIRLR